MKWRQQATEAVTTVDAKLFCTNYLGLRINRPIALNASLKLNMIKLLVQLGLLGVAKQYRFVLILRCFWQVNLTPKKNGDNQLLQRATLSWII